MEIDPVLSKMMFQKTFRYILVLVGLALLFTGYGMFRANEVLDGVIVLLVGLGLVVLPFTPYFKKALEFD